MIGGALAQLTAPNFANILKLCLYFIAHKPLVPKPEQIKGKKKKKKKKGPSK